MLPLGVPQIVISGAADPVVPAPFGRIYAQLAAAAGDKVEEMTLPNAGHFELIDPQSAAFEQRQVGDRKIAEVNFHPLLWAFPPRRDSCPYKTTGI